MKLFKSDYTDSTIVLSHIVYFGKNEEKQRVGGNSRYYNIKIVPGIQIRFSGGHSTSLFYDDEYDRDEDYNTLIQLMEELN